LGVFDRDQQVGPTLWVMAGGNGRTKKGGQKTLLKKQGDMKRVPE